MSKEFDKYLKKGGITQQDIDAIKQEDIRDISVDSSQSPGDVQSSYTTDTRDAHKRELSQAEQSPEQIGEDLKEQGVEVEPEKLEEINTQEGGLSKYQTQAPQQQGYDKQMEQDIDRWEDDGGR